jgi:hypothetical protein
VYFFKLVTIVGIVHKSSILEHCFHPELVDDAKVLGERVEGNPNDIIPRCLDESLEEHQNAEIDSNLENDALRISNTKHSYLSPTTKRNTQRPLGGCL